MKQEKISGLMFSGRLRAEMEKLDVTQHDLAVAVGVTQSAVSGWLKGAVPKIDKLHKIADRLGVAVNWLLTGEGNRQNYVSKLAETARRAAEVKDQVDPEQVIFDLLMERQRTERLEAELAEVREQLHKLREAVLQGAPMIEQMLKVAKSH